MSINNCDRCGRDLVDPQARYGWRCEKIMGAAPSSFAKFLSDRYLMQYDIDPKHINLSKLYAATDKTILSRLTDNDAMRREALLDAYSALGFQQDDVDPNVFTSTGVRPSAVITLQNWFGTIWDNVLHNFPSILPKFFAPKNDTPSGRSGGSYGKFGESAPAPFPIPTLPPLPMPILTSTPSPTSEPTSLPVYASCYTQKIPREQQIANAEYIFDYLKNTADWSTEAICGLLGNIEHESYLNPGARGNANSPNSRYGLVQWINPKDRIYKWAGLTAEGADYLATFNPQELMDLQLSCLIESCRPSYSEWLADKAVNQYHAPYKMSFDDFIHSDNEPGELAVVFSEHYERSGASLAQIESTRAANARKWYEYFSGR